MEFKIKHGLPRKVDYSSLLSSSTYIRQRKYSDVFLSKNDLELHDYKLKWVVDPLHQWSRQWEYPYVEQEIKKLANDNGECRVLDAGSGVTFFSYLLAEYYGYDVTCFDQDQSLSDIYKSINLKNKKNVHFKGGDLRNIEFEDSYFDAIYCISVLEHTDQYEKIVEEFYRILKPGGSLVVTFDISIDGKRDIDIFKSKKLVRDLCRIFSEDSSKFLTELDSLEENFVYSTEDACKLDKMLLPWERPDFIKKITNYMLGKSKSWPPRMTFFCISLKK